MPNKHKIQLAAEYENDAAEISAQLSRLNKLFSYASSIRLLIFVSVILAVWLIRPGFNVILGIAFTGIVLFLIVFKWHTGIIRKREFTSAKLKLINDESARLKNGHGGFYEGKEFTDPQHPYTSDLDIFGENSIFQFLNRCSLSGGRAILAGWLKVPAPKEEIMIRQEAISELSERKMWRFDFSAWAEIAKEKGEKEFFISGILASPEFSNNKFIRWIIWILPAITITAWTLSFYDLPINIPITLSLIQLGILGWKNKKIMERHNLMSNGHKVLESYSAMLAILENTQWKSGKMASLTQALRHNDRSAGDILRESGSIISTLDSRNNPILLIFGNALFLRDLHTIIRLERWIEKYGGMAEKWLVALHETEALCSFAMLHHNEASFSFPLISDGPFSLKSINLAHPLISESKRIGNDLALEGEGRIMLITGSNMAGKSTLIRAAGVNAVLALAGSPVCAGSFECSHFTVFTSMRIGDSVAEGDSTFFAELKRLKAIVDSLKRGEKLFLLLDEILRGTNSADKLKGSEAFLRQVIRLGASGLVATHDLTLAELEKEMPENIINANLEVEISGDNFHFDYKLKPGVCKIMNATQLMRKMGIEVPKPS